MKRWMTGMLLMGFILTHKAMSQKNNYVKAGDEFLPLIIVYAPVLWQDSLTKQLKEEMLQEKVRYHYVVFGYTSCASDSLAKEVNQLLNTVHWIDKQKIYLLVYGESSCHQVLDKIDKSIFADTYFEPIHPTTPPTNWYALFRQFDKKYVWGKDIFDIEEKRKTAVFQKKDWNGLLYLGFHHQNDFNKDSSYLPSFYTTYGIGIDYRLTSHLHLQGRMGISVKIPNKKKMQSQLQSQMNPSASGGNQSITIEIATHFILEQSLQANYLFRLQKKWQPYVGAGLMAVNFTASHKKETKSINIASASSLESSFGGNANMPIFSGVFVNPFISFGTNASVSENSAFVFNGNVTLPNGKTYQGVKPGFGLQNLSIQCGLSFRLGKKAKYYYKYVQ